MAETHPQVLLYQAAFPALSALVHPAAQARFPLPAQAHRANPAPAKALLGNL